MKKFKQFSLAITMLFCIVSFGQERTISGIVSDGHEAFPFVNILIKGTAKGTQTDFDGKFSIKAKKGDKLVFSYVGFDNYELEIGEKISEYFIKLKSNAVLLEERYGLYPVPRKKNFPSTSTISEEELKKPPTEKTQVKTHCTKSINANNKPLVIIDGEIASENILETIDPNSIATVKVLKDKEATELYGSKAQFGVIIIETKEYQEKINNNKNH